MSTLTVYPSTNYDSWISWDDAEEYFKTRMNNDSWTDEDQVAQEVALQTAFRSLEELSLDLTDLDSDVSDEVAAILKALTQAQCEQALHELTFDVDGVDVKSISLGGLLSMSVQEGEKAARFSPRALKMLANYRTIRTIARIR